MIILFENRQWKIFMIIKIMFKVKFWNTSFKIIIFNIFKLEYFIFRFGNSFIELFALSFLEVFIIHLYLFLSQGLGFSFLNITPNGTLILARLKILYLWLGFIVQKFSELSNWNCPRVPELKFQNIVVLWLVSPEHQ